MTLTEEEQPSPPSKKARVDEVAMEVRRRKLEVRYLGAKFVDRESSNEVFEIVRIEFEPEDAVWVAQCKREDSSSGEEQPYYLNQDVDGMIDEYRRQSRDDQDGIEVVWEVCDEEAGEAPRNVWWRARVLGKSEETYSLTEGDEVCDLEVWNIEYEARPELSEPETVRHKICFLSSRALFDVTAKDSLMQWRKQGSQDPIVDILSELVEEEEDEEEEESKKEASIDDECDRLVDSAVQSAFEGALKAKYDALPRDRQCVVADVVVAAKQKLKQALAAHCANKALADKNVVTPDDVAAVVDTLKAELKNLPTVLDGLANNTNPQPA